MKIIPIAICILPIGLSLATMSEAKDKDHHRIKHPSHLHKHADHSHHNRVNYQCKHLQHHAHAIDKEQADGAGKHHHHHDNAAAAIPHVPYHGDDDSKEHGNEGKADSVVFLSNQFEI